MKPCKIRAPLSASPVGYYNTSSENKCEWENTPTRTSMSFAICWLPAAATFIQRWFSRSFCISGRNNRLLEARDKVNVFWKLLIQNDPLLFTVNNPKGNGWTHYTVKRLFRYHFSLRMNRRTFYTSFKSNPIQFSDTLGVATHENSHSERNLEEKIQKTLTSKISVTAAKFDQTSDDRGPYISYDVTEWTA